jgi:hypothetical protein
VFGFSRVEHWLGTEFIQNNMMQHREAWSDEARSPYCTSTISFSNRVFFFSCILVDFIHCIVYNSHASLVFLGNYDIYNIISLWLEIVIVECGTSEKNKALK